MRLGCFLLISKSVRFEQGENMKLELKNTTQNIALTLWAGVFLPMCASAQSTLVQTSTTTPIKHVIVIVGENRTFDNLFATYKPQGKQRIDNLLSKGIVKADGSPGPNFHLAQQRIAENYGAYNPTPAVTGTYNSLPQPFALGAFGQRKDIADQRFPSALANGPYPITKYVSYGAHTGDPVHRFFQMWQQVNGGKNDLFVWTAQTAGLGPSNGPAPFSPENTYQGAIAMGFYNMARGDAPIFKKLADQYAIADNYHQPVMGGTTVNYFALATGDVAFHTLDGKPGVPSQKLIENPDSQANKNNWYTEDGYRGGTYVNCADRSAPGVAGIMKHLESLPYKVFRDGNCDPDHFYMVNNLDPAFTATGELIPLDDSKFILPPQTIPHIGDALSAAGVTWKWYSGGRNDGKNVDKEYCGMCDTPTFFTSTMLGADKAKLQDLSQFYLDIRKPDGFPSVAYIAPYDSISGHPGYATEPNFDEFVIDVISRVKENPKLWKETAILVTFDEGGGYYDSGYIQMLDFFGDGTRIPLLAVSPYSKRGFVDHTYYDHASILKFIQKNWGLKPI